MKVILFSDYYYPTIKSGSIVIKDLATELARLGHEAIVVTFNEKQKESFLDSKEGDVRVIRIKCKLRKYVMIGRLIAEIRYSSLIIRSLKKLR